MSDDSLESESEASLSKKSDRLNRSLTARASRKKTKAIKKIKSIKAELQSMKIFNKESNK